MSRTALKTLWKVCTRLDLCSNQGFQNVFYGTFMQLLYNIVISSRLTEFTIFITMNWAVFAEMFSCYEGRHRWNWCQKETFLVSSLFFRYRLRLICLLFGAGSFLTGLNSSLHILGCSEAVVSSVYLWVLFFIFFRILEELSLHCKTLACLDMGRQPDMIEKLPEGKV